MLDKLIKDKADFISFSSSELSNIASTLSNLKTIINSEQDFGEPFLGGSYKRATMVKGVSDVDVYFRYFGTKNPDSALENLKNCLLKSYPKTDIKRDKPSILADFNKIPINITPYKEDAFGNMSIPDSTLSNWQRISFGVLEAAITDLRRKNAGFIDLIKILKLWNKNYNKGVKNFEIEKKVCDIFLYPTISSTAISDWIYTFFSNTGNQVDANRFFPLMKKSDSDSTLKTEWLKFIDR